MKLILGGSGQLGSSFRRLFPDAESPPRSQLDVTDNDQLDRYLGEFAPDSIINCSGFTDVDGAEEDQEQAMAVNTVAVGELAQIADRHEIPFVTFSSDYVFDGRSENPYIESSPTNPINSYGESKLAGERLALQYPGSLVVRTSWLFSSTHRNFVSTIVRIALSGGPLRVVDDQYGSPTHVDDLAAAVMRAVERGVIGVVHLASGPAASWHQLAQSGLKAAGLDPRLAVPCTTDEYPVKAQRPQWSVLASERHDDNQWFRLPDWTVAMPGTVGALFSRGF